MTTEQSSTTLTWACEPPENPVLAGEVHLWMDDGLAATNCDRDDVIRLLSREERDRQLRYVSPELQERFARRHVMLRQVLSHYQTEVRPEQWRYRYNAFGRPSLDPQMFGNELHFNLSHSKNRTLLAIAACDGIGVDIEHAIVAPDTNHLDVAEQYFTTAECCWINGAAPEGRMNRFLDLWTLKESYIKARGLGLSLPLDHFQFSIIDVGAVVLQELNSHTATDTSWQFRLYALETHYRYAIALQHAGAQLFDVSHFHYPGCLCNS